jgi:hypothetical protein
MNTDTEYTWANLPTTCPDFVSHPHRVQVTAMQFDIDGTQKEITREGNCYTCQVAACSESQGTTALASALLDLNIACDIHQTGGFTMCVYIKTDANDASYIYANAEGFSHYISDSDDGENWYFGDDLNEQSAAQKAQKIADTMKDKNLQALEI